MSLTKIKSKENKGKQKNLPKLKAILANPNKTRCPVLDEEELGHLKFLLQNAIEQSKLEPKAFATKSGICLGLESSLRKINNQTSSCVFISLSIKPNYVISLIARNAKNKDVTQPVFAQPKLENFIQEIFNIQALCMVFPKDLLAIDETLNSWVEKRRTPQKIKNISEEPNKTRKKNVRKKRRKLIEIEDSTTKADHIKNETKTMPEKTNKPWSGDFISFGNQNPQTNSRLDGNEAIDALSEIIEKLPTTTKAIAKDQENEPMEVDSITDLPTLKTASDNTDSDDFLGDYKALTVHKIKGNPNKNPKKKRKKNKKKNQIKK